MSKDAVLKVKVVPNSSRNQVMGWLGDALKVKLQAPPEDGKANKALRQLIAGVLGIAEKRVSIEFGERSVEKLIRIQGVDGEGVMILLNKVMKK